MRKKSVHMSRAWNYDGKTKDSNTIEDPSIVESMNKQKRTGNKLRMKW